MIDFNSWRVPCLGVFNKTRRSGRFNSSDRVLFLSTGNSGLYLDTILDSVVAEWDWGVSASYPGTGDSVESIIPTPANGDAQGDYTISGMSSLTFTTDHVVFDGTNVLSLASMSNFIRDLCDPAVGQDFTIGIAIESLNTAFESNSYVSTAFGGAEGIQLRNDLSERFFLRQVTGVDTDSSKSLVATNKAGPHIIIVSHSFSGNTTRVWLDGQAVVEAAHTFAAVTTPSTGMYIGGSSTLTERLDTDDYIYWLAVLNEYIDDTKAQSIISHIETRHSRDYNTP